MIKSDANFIYYSKDLVYKTGTNPKDGLSCKHCHCFIYDNRFEKTIFKTKAFVIHKKSKIINIKCVNCGQILEIPFLALDYFEHNGGFLPL